MDECVAPQTRQYWHDYLSGKDVDALQRSLQTAEDGLRRYAEESTRLRHDWTIYRNCCLRELRRRGLGT